MRLRSARFAPARLGAMAMALALVLAACGGSDDAPAPEPADDAPEETDEPEDADEPDDAALPFEGETIRTVVGYDPGGSYDDAARWMQPFLEETTGATNVIENMPGAGNLIALNHIWASDPDGTTIGTLNGPGTTVTVLTESDGGAIEFDLAEFSFLAGLTSEPRLMTVGADSPYESFEDMLESGDTIQFGVTGTSGAGYNDAVFMQGVFGDQMGIQIVSGFDSGAETQLALVRGEVDAAFNLLGGEIPAIEAGEVRGLVVIGLERSPALPDVPAITEYDLSDEVLDLLEVHITISQLGIILTAPPNMPAEILDPLRAAVWDAANAPALVEDALSAGVAWNPRTGEEIREAIELALNAPDRYVDLMVEAIGGG